MKIEVEVTDEQIEKMVTRFLGWRLPKSFAPDAGISFKPMPDEYMPHYWPTGTNLFDAPQAKEMILHILGATDSCEQKADAKRKGPFNPPRPPGYHPVA